jgi:tetratricopeptide (TPR) repeat protein
MSAFPLRRAILNLRARYHLWSGRRAYRLGRLRAAGRHFREALTCGLESFEAYLLLGKICYRENDLARAATFFARARNADPTRYLLEGFPDDFIETLRERQHAAITDRPEYRVVIESARKPGKPAAPTVRVPRGAGRERPPGDFASRDEWLRHRDKPALRPGEGHDVDWDEAARKLFGE